MLLLIIHKFGKRSNFCKLLSGLLRHHVCLFYLKDFFFFLYSRIPGFLRNCFIMKFSYPCVLDHFYYSVFVSLILGTFLEFLKSYSIAQHLIHGRLVPVLFSSHFFHFVIVFQVISTRGLCSFGPSGSTCDTICFPNKQLFYDI